MNTTFALVLGIILILGLLACTYHDVGYTHRREFRRELKQALKGILMFLVFTIGFALIVWSAS